MKIKLLSLVLLSSLAGTVNATENDVDNKLGTPTRRVQATTKAPSSAEKLKAKLLENKKAATVIKQPDFGGASSLGASSFGADSFPSGSLNLSQSIPLPKAEDKKPIVSTTPVVSQPLLPLSTKPADFSAFSGGFGSGFSGGFGADSTFGAFQPLPVVKPQTTPVVTQQPQTTPKEPVKIENVQAKTSQSSVQPVKVEPAKVEKETSKPTPQLAPLSQFTTSSFGGGGFGAGDSSFAFSSVPQPLPPVTQQPKTTPVVTQQPQITPKEPVKVEPAKVEKETSKPTPQLAPLSQFTTSSFGGGGFGSGFGAGDSSFAFSSVPQPLPPVTQQPKTTPVVTQQPQITPKEPVKVEPAKVEKETSKSTPQSTPVPQITPPPFGGSFSGGFDRSTFDPFESKPFPVVTPQTTPKEPAQKKDEKATTIQPTQSVQPAVIHTVEKEDSQKAPRSKSVDASALSRVTVLQDGVVSVQKAYEERVALLDKEIEGRKKEIEGRKKEIEARDQEIEAQKLYIVKLEATRDDSAREIERLTLKLDSNKKQLEQMKTVQASSGVTVDLSGEVKRLTEENEDLESQITKVKAANKKLGLDMQEALKQKGELVKENKTLLSQIAETQKLAIEAEEAFKLALQKAEKDLLEAQKLAGETQKQATEAEEAHKLALQKAEKDLLEAQKLAGETQKQATEAEEAHKLALQKAEKDLLEAQRVAKETGEQAIEAEEAHKLALQKAEKDLFEAQRVAKKTQKQAIEAEEAHKLALQKAEKDLLEAQKLAGETQKQATEAEEAHKLALQKAEKDLLEAQRLAGETQKQATEAEEAHKLALQKAEKDLLEAQRVAKETQKQAIEAEEAHKLALQKAEKDLLEAQRVAKETQKQATEAEEAHKLALQKAEKDLLEAQKLAKETQKLATEAEETHKLDLEQVVGDRELLLEQAEAAYKKALEQAEEAHQLALEEADRILADTKRLAREQAEHAHEAQQQLLLVRAHYENEAVAAQEKYSELENLASDGLEDAENQKNAAIESNNVIIAENRIIQQQLLNFIRGSLPNNTGVDYFTAPLEDVYHAHSTTPVAGLLTAQFKQFLEANFEPPAAAVEASAEDDSSSTGL